MKNLEQIFSPIIGQYTWGIEIPHEKIMFLNFAQPVLRIREPHTPKRQESEKTRRRMEHRSVTPEGEYTLIISGEDYSLTTRDYTIHAIDVSRTDLTEAVAQLDGQKCLQVFHENEKLIFVFDLEGRLEISMPIDKNDTDCWMFNIGFNDYISYNSTKGLETS